MKANALVGEIAAVAGKIDPITEAPGSNTVTSEWVDLGKFQHILAVAQLGQVGSGSTLDAKLEQAQDSAGTGAKDIAGKAITQLVGTDDNKVAQINLRAPELDIDNSFGFARLSITVNVAALETAEAAGIVMALGPTFSPIDTTALGVVAEIVS